MSIEQTYWNKQESITSAVPVITADHAFIHEKKGFTLAGKMDIASAGVGAIQLTVPGATAATLTTNMTNALADVTLTAVKTGTDGNSINVVYVDPAANDQPLTVSVFVYDITVTLATGEAGAITSTGAEVAAAINAHPEASALVTASDEGDGSGIVNAVVVANLAGGVNPVYCHFKPSLITCTGGPVTVELVEDQSFVAAGTAGTPRNRHRINGPASAITCKSIAAATLVGGSAVILDTVVIPGNSVAGKLGGSTAAAEEWVLNPGKTYIVSMTNATNPGATITAGYSLFWYEEEGA